MKKLFTALMLMVLISANVFCQPPQAFKYQAVVRNSSGDIIANQAVGIQINIRNGLPLGQIVYQETHTVSTNEFGLVNLEIGKGIPNVTMGTFDAINWSLNPKFLEVLVDPAGGTNYISMGTSELQSVPYALYSRIAANSPWELNGNDIYFNNGNLGIGTSSPQYRLDVWAPGTTSTGIGVFRNSLGENKIVLRQNSNGCGAMNLYNATGEASLALVGAGNSYINGGGLGIGTTTIANAKLQIEGPDTYDAMVKLNNTGTNGASFFMGSTNSAWGGGVNENLFVMGYGAPASSNIDLTVNPSGYLGIGTTAPSTNLVVKSAGYTHGMYVNSSNDQPIFRIRQNSDESGSLYLYDELGNTTVGISGGGNSYLNNGRLGIGTTGPLAGLHLVGDQFPNSFIYIQSDASQDAGFRLYEGSTAKWHIFNNSALGGLQIYNTASQTVFFANQSGNVGIGTTSPTSRLDVRGNVTIRDNSTGAIAVELGTGLDYAEGFNVSDKTNIEPGTVLCIDSENPGNLKISCQSYDTKVAGIVAGANNLGTGVSLGSGIHDLNVALAGRVYCNVDASSSSVEVGDLLTTSYVPGFAMKVLDRDKAQGAILGKAMESLEKGQKKQILVLVTLQ